MYSLAATCLLYARNVPTTIPSESDSAWFTSSGSFSLANNFGAAASIRVAMFGTAPSSLSGALGVPFKIVKSKGSFICGTGRSSSRVQGEPWYTLELSSLVTGSPTRSNPAVCWNSFSIGRIAPSGNTCIFSRFFASGPKYSRISASTTLASMSCPPCDVTRAIRSPGIFSYLATLPGIFASFAVSMIPRANFASAAPPIKISGPYFVASTWNLSSALSLCLCPRYHSVLLRASRKGKYASSASAPIPPTAAAPTGPAAAPPIAAPTLPTTPTFCTSSPSLLRFVSSTSSCARVCSSH